VEEVGDWLSSAGLSKHAVTFNQHAIDGEVLLLLNSSDLEKLGLVSQADIRTFEQSLYELKTQIRTNVALWSEKKVRRWLRKQNIQQFLPIFRAKHINGKKFIELSDSDFTDNNEVTPSALDYLFFLREGILGTPPQPPKTPSVSLSKENYALTMSQIQSPCVHPQDRPIPVPILHLQNVPTLQSRLGSSKLKRVGKSKTRPVLNRPSINEEGRRTISGPLKPISSLTLAPRLKIKFKKVTEDEVIWKDIGPEDSIEDFQFWIVEYFGVRYTPRILVESRAVRFETNNDMKCLYHLASLGEVSVFLYEKP
jgi:hypothetical protein